MRHRLPGIVVGIAILAFGRTAAADEAPPVAIQPAEAYKHGGHGGVGVTGPVQPYETVMMEIVVGPSGAVVSATPTQGGEQHLAEATAEVMGWRYRPFVDDRGLPLTVTYGDVLYLYDNKAAGPIPVTWEEADTHRRDGGPYGVLTTADFDPDDAVVRFRVVVAPDGRVAAVVPTQGPQDAYADVVRAVSERSYQPFTWNGVPAIVSFEDSAALQTVWLPPVHVPFPAIETLDTVEIGVARSPCTWSFASCRIEIRGDGSVTFIGDGDLAVPGRHEARLAPEVVAAMLDRFRAVDFFSLQDRYIAPVTNQVAETLSLEIGDASKSVLAYAGRRAGLPEDAARLGTEILDLAGAARWIEGTAESVGILRADGFDLHSQAAADALAGAAHRKAADFFIALLEAGVPLSGMGGTPGPDPVASLARLDPRMARALVDAAVARGTAVERTLTLGLAAELGDEAAVAALIEGGGDPTAAGRFLLFFNLALTGRTDWLQPWQTFGFPPDDVSYALFGAAVADSADAARLLVEGHADPRIRDGRGDTPLHLAAGPGVADVLLAAGAHLEAVDEAGATPLVATRSEAAALALIRAGADVGVRTAEGTSVLDRARSRGWKEVVALLGG